MKQKKDEGNFFQKLIANRYFRRLSVPIVVIIIGAVMLITAPWQTDIPIIEEPTVEPVIIIEPPPDDDFNAPGETPMPDDDGVLSMDDLPTPPPETPPPDPGTGIVNPLTGEAWNEDFSNLRPWGVTIDNHRAALPTLGLGKADIIIEFLVEGGITRLIALYQDLSNVGTIGGIRSLRTSSMEIAQGFDAIFTHWMGNTYDQVVTTGNPVTRYNTIDASSGGIGFRYTGKSSPHNGVSSGERLLKGLPASFRTEHDGFEQQFSFAADGTPEGGKSAERITVSFISNSKNTTFTYNSSDEKYYVRQYTQDLIDGNDKEKVSFTNVIIMQTGVQTNYNAPGHTFVRTTGEGNAFFACGGKYIEAKWGRKDLSSPYAFYNLDGTPLELGVGKTYICIVSTNETPIFE